jgi:hypothetical protein
MSSRLTAGDRKLLLTAAAVSLLLTVLGVAFSPEGNTSDSPTTYSAGSGGAKAAYLLLNGSGYSVQRWERSLVDLPDTATLILAEPDGAPSMAERQALDRFIDRGGRVIASGTSGALFLPEHRVVPDPIAGATWKRLSSRSPAAVTRAAPEITLAPRGFWIADNFVLPLYGDDDRLRAIKYDRGQGEVIWLASATPVTNAGLREPGNLEFVLACLGDPRRPILWDEYFHGYRQASSASLTTQPLAWIGLQLALLASAVLLTYSRRSGPVIPPATDSRLSPLEFVRTLGSLYERAGAASVAVDIALQRFRYRLTRRLGMPINATPDELEAAVRRRWNIDGRELGELLRSCHAARGDATLKPEAAFALTSALSKFAAKHGVFRT